MNGIILLDKPQDWTSHDVVNKIKRITGRKVGHAGTLDPFATGVLVVLIGEATKINRFLANDDKSYKGTIVFGKKTDTLDVTGKIIYEINASFISENLVKESFKKFIGEIEQKPPAYSAKKVNGKKSYKLARKGLTVDLKKIKVNIYNLKLIAFRNDTFPEADFEVKVSKGTYIRSLADDIGNFLKTGAYLKKLRRTLSGNFKIQDSLSMEDLIGDKAIDFINKKLISINDALKLTKVTVTENAKKLILNGAAIKPDYTVEKNLPQNKTVKIVDMNGRILSVQKIQKGKVLNLAVFNNS